MIQDLRARRGLNLNALARSSGVSVGHLSKVERGREQLTWGVARKVAPALGVSPLAILVAEFGEAKASDDRERVANALHQMSEAIRDPGPLTDAQVEMLANLSGEKLLTTFAPVRVLTTNRDDAEDWDGTPPKVVLS